VTWWEALLLGAHGLVSACLLVYALQMYALLLLSPRGRRRAPPRAPLPDRSLPRVTVQVPLYNEKWVARRIIRAVCEFDYPRDRLDVQVLDDSTDETRRIVDDEAAAQRARGVDIAVLRRPNRVDYKAGALQAGLERCRGEYVALFDADFVPPRGWLRDVLPDLAADPSLGWVQTRWAHLNGSESWLTRAQALGIDGHFAVEQPARVGAGFFANFNGTAGIWRKAAILDAGGWVGDTLTEDLDLSYRAQFKGWRMAYRMDVAVPAELPVEAGALKAQQFRWAKGSMQTARKHLMRVWTSPLPLPRKVAATLHLTGYAIAPLMVASVALAFPMLLLTDRPVPVHWMIVGSVMSLIGTSAPLILYASAQAVLYPGRWKNLTALPLLMALGMGISLNTAWAVGEGLCGRRSPFFRTPKKGDRRARSGYAAASGRLHLLELAAGAACAVAAAFHSARGHFPLAALLGLYAAGFVVVGMLTWKEIRETKPAAPSGPVTVAPA
jgi:cellulose synthase/poly-beta-1,6-N-acetylglucosamine synthase-like glycosyltransferase